MFKAPSSNQVLVYISIPFCNSKCHFCSWASGYQKSEVLLRKGDDLRKRYIDRLVCECAELRKIVEDSGASTHYVYWGGGTPSELSLDELRQLSEALRWAVESPSCQGFTIECAPQSLTPAKASDLRSIGCDRVSMGAQSFNDKILRKIGRAHSARAIEVAVDGARSAGFSDINLDLIMGLPEESWESAQNSLRQAVALGVEHLSVYPYMPDQNSVLGKRWSHALQQQSLMAREMYESGAKLLESLGFEEYMTAYFRKRGSNRRCVVDEVYFGLRSPWLGAGAGAHSLFNQLEHENPRSLEEYVATPPRTLSSFRVPSEHHLTRLLFQAGWGFGEVDENRWQELTGIPLEDVGQLPRVFEILHHMRKSRGSWATRSAAERQISGV